MTAQWSEGFDRALTPGGAVLARRLIGQSWRLTRVLWPLAALIAVIVGACISRFTPVTESIWENAGQWPHWVLFSLATGLVSLYLPIAVAHGVTRRAAFRALAVTAVTVTLSWAACMVAGQLAERLIYHWLDWPDVLTGSHLFTSGSHFTGADVLPMFADYGLLFLGYAATGALVGAAYFRLGGRLGTVVLPLTLLPVVVIEALLSTGWLGRALDSSGRYSVAAPVALGGALVVVLLTGWLTEVLLREAPLPAKAG